ncbi:hypothetical protein B0H16DRAFT_1723625 [Mycena metata]|uniref:Ribonuclease H1 N-terminal domain-containing protein n=1 Tax=Mycena metata TaxID=1033252 RepID=A0AAD7NA71_9AGAR|nr:hypothetical protein B0H16DRAFT_1723625 [Mycena metata]
MAPHDLTVSELADLIAPANHPQRLSADELEALTSHISEAQLDDVIRRLGVGIFVRQLPPTFHRVLSAVRRVARDPSPAYDEDIDDLVHDFDEQSLETSTPPPSSPEPPVTPPRARQVQSTPSTPQTGAQYEYTSPTATGRTLSWFQAGALTQGVPGASVRTVRGHPSRSHSTRRAAAYAVFFGGEIGVFTSWADVESRIKGHGLAIYGGYASAEAAVAALHYAREKGWTGDSNPPPYNAGPPIPSQLHDNPLNAGTDNTNWYAVCRGIAPGVYRSWLECSLNVSGVKNSLHAAYNTRAKAEEAFNLALRRGLVKTLVREPVD